MSRRRHPPPRAARADLDKLGTARITLLEAEHRIHELALEARAKGATWTDVGEALQISRQAAQQRFG